jgi:hypothetical protein
VGLAGIALGIVFQARTSTLVSDAGGLGCNTSAHPVQCPDDPNGRSGLSKMDDARTVWRPLTIASFVAGGVLTAGGITLYFTAPRERATAFVVSPILPSPHAAGGGLAASGAF